MPGAVVAMQPTRSRGLATLVIAALLVAAGAASVQAEEATGAVAGVVSESRDHAPLAGVTVVASAPADARRRPGPSRGRS